VREARVARSVLRVLAWLVPAADRADWIQEWEGEFDALLSLRRTEDARRYPHPLMFVAGAWPHVMWLRRRELGMVGDIRYAVRLLRRSPGFTLIAASTLALGIGANGAIFSLVNGLVLRPPAGMQEPERLVQVGRSYDTAPRWDNWSSPAADLIGLEASTFSGVAGYGSQTFVVGYGQQTEQVTGQYVTGSYFDVLGVRPALGRLLRPSDDVEPGGHAVVVLGYGLWQRRFGGEPGVIGTTIRLGATPFSVVGVAPPGFQGPDVVGAPPVLWVPRMQHAGWFGRLPFGEWGSSWLNVVARLAPAVTFEQARVSMETVTMRLRQASEQNEDIRVLVAEGVGLDPDERAEAVRISMLLLGIVGAVLLLTCTNVANLMLARGLSRTTEMSIRKALGAGRSRLARQLVIESVLLAAFATALAVPIVVAMGRLLPLVVPYTVAVSMGADVRVYAFLVAIGLLAGLLFGAAPAWATSRGDILSALRTGRQGGRPRSRLRDILVVVQLALSLGLVTGAALLGRSVRNARTADPGFQPENLTVALADPGATGRYDETSGRALVDRLIPQLEAVPGVSSATVANQAPIAGGHSRAGVQPTGRDDLMVEAEFVLVGPRYFETLGIQMVRGRALGAPAHESGFDVVINESLAELFWPGADPIGRELESAQPLRVIGIVRDVQMRSLRSRANPAVYYSYGRGGGPNDLVRHAFAGPIALHVRTARPVPGLEAGLRRAVAAVDPDLPVGNVVELKDALAASMGETRTIGRLVAGFAALALILAAVGLYGVVSYGVSRRVRELGVRIALGAEPASLVRLVLGHGLGLAAAGVLFGLGTSFLVGQAFRGLLFDVPPSDPLTLGGAALLLVATAGLAAWIPARRAARVEPAASLREPGG